MWLEEPAACQFIGRHRRTLLRWRRAGMVVARRTRYGWEYEKQSLRAAKTRMAQRAEEQEQNGGRPFKYRPKPGDMDPLF